jgi:hypothetical protein
MNIIILYFLKVFFIYGVIFCLIMSKRNFRFFNANPFRVPFHCLYHVTFFSSKLWGWYAVLYYIWHFSHLHFHHPFILYYVQFGQRFISFHSHIPKFFIISLSFHHLHFSLYYLKHSLASWPASSSSSSPPGLF